VCDFLQVSKPFVFSRKVKAIKLRERTVQPRKIVRVSGWGVTKCGGFSAKYLQQVAVPVVQQQKCEQLDGGGLITSNMFCAGKGGRGAYRGDSGGAVVYRHRQVGIVSWGRGCATYFPGVYTNVGKFRTWILNKSGVKMEY
jgi:secreted trypsin-like serine protease